MSRLRPLPLSRWWLRVWFVFVVIVGLISNVPANAQTNRLVYGQTVNGQITKDEFRRIYTFQGRQGDIVEASLKSTDGKLDPVLILTDEQNNVIAMDDDDAGDYNAILPSIRLTKDGLYFLIATRFGQDRGLTTGAFTLTLTRVGIVSNDAQPEGTVLQYGDSVVKEINATVSQHLFAFSALRGDIISVTMQRISGDLDPMLVLADAQGTVILSSDDDPESPGTLDAAIRNLRIQQTGNYVIIATRFGQEAGTSGGGFSLKLEKLGAESIGRTPDFPELLDVGTMVTGSISKDLLRRYYQIEAKAGEVLTVEVKRTKGNLDPTVQLYNGDGQRLLASNDAGARGVNARISAFRVLLDGQYLIVVSRFNGDTGITSGDYSLLVTPKEE
ncbi:MAG: PPC domain-containing protein [Anaerolineae bacterium]|nr:PPC domain-containing protein [Anaerolineae bacterium]